MKIELYDIITLKNGNEYTVLRMLNHHDKKYYLLAPVDLEEEPDLENVKIVYEINKNEKIFLKEESDKQLSKEIIKLFLSSMKEVIE